MLRWLLLSAVVSGLAGTASAGFLVALDWVTHFRETHLSYWQLLVALPLGGLAVGLLYQYFGQRVVKGNNQLLEEIHHPRDVVPLRMAPLVLLGTLLTHLVGGSAGREGTAVQMGGALADQLSRWRAAPALRWLHLRPHDRRLLLVAGISAGFASVFGTPLAGAVFGLEVLLIGRLRYEALLPSVLAAFGADWVTRAWGVGHTAYAIPVVPALSPTTVGITLGCGVLFGLTARAFVAGTHGLAGWFQRRIAWPPLRPVVGGVALALLALALQASLVPDVARYLGLGVPTIVAAFAAPLPWYSFGLKMFFTSLTLGAGFKGGEVTPLFFVGAALGSALASVLPLPVALLAGMGFVAVFSGAANTPLACTLMGLELFGTAGAAYLALACVVAYLFSGHRGIYGAQVVGTAKHPHLARDEGQPLGSLPR
ncbi:voltage-gated chloride channel family protein [Hymenobacter busanensis]|uniref:Voltage-gated chloride channel family protein n=1 Tax=Hymenobacter busanensis TaxID=2607656 RepID=A0A7L5A1F8_9BACT|nr:voltage-gated chloride channel family protein [Hymenobacter busanensis]QHJ09614.1 chloride channel protein [Hymenobacter busanensis]